MNKVKIKCDPGKRPDRAKLLSILAANDKCFKVQEIKGDGYLVWCNSDADTDLLFSDHCRGALNTIQCEPQLPPEIKAKRTVILRQVDDSILGRNNEDIITELQGCNDWLKVADIYVFPSSPTMKIVCDTNEMATRALNNGVRLFNLSIPPTNIQQEKFINLLTCYRCYAIEDHQASSCGKSKEHKICSVCAMTGHTYKQCTSSTKKCINCGGAHTTLAMSCPERKRKTNEKKFLLKQHKSYADAAS